MSDPPEDLLREVARWRSAPRERPALLETPGPGQESVWDYPRPPRVEAEAREVRVELGGVNLARSKRALRVLETASPPVYYVPAADVRVDLLEPSENGTLCEWKGRARHWSAHVGTRRVPDAAWSYPEPFGGFEALRDHLAFYPGRVDACSVGGHPATPQPGGYYGGWITPWVVGPFKGAPGTERW